MKTMRSAIYFGAIALAGAGLILAQGAPDDDKLLTTFQNPIGNLISVPFQNNVNFPIGQYSRVQDLLNIQPVIPISLNEDWLLITRWITPVVYQPDISVPTGGANGLGDLNPSFFLSPTRPGKLIWGVGPTFLLPTATDPTLGQGKWAAGPSIVLLVQPEHWTIGFLSNNVWSIGGEKDRPEVNQFLTQYFITYNMNNGWFFTESPILTADWIGPVHNRWLVPFGGGFGKISRFGSQPYVWQVNVYYNLIRPQDIPSPKWQVRLQVALLYPKAK
jgi:hypothetical protein